jgi:carbon storage regulator CsrA
MLVLTRKIRESIVVGGSTAFEQVMKVTVLDIGGGKVKLGFEVDKDVPVHRSEVWERIQSIGQQNGQTPSRGPPVPDGNGDHPPLPGNGAPPPMKLADCADGVHRKHGILVVDDDQSVRGVLRAAMAQQGLAVWLAADGQQALDVYQRNGDAIDVVLVDLRMPVLDGTQTLAALQEINPQIRCCFMTGDLGSYTEESLLGLGAAAVIRKPFRPAEVALVLWDLARSAQVSGG